MEIREFADMDKFEDYYKRYYYQAVVIEQVARVTMHPNQLSDSDVAVLLE